MLKKSVKPKSIVKKKAVVKEDKKTTVKKASKPPKPKAVKLPSEVKTKPQVKMPRVKKSLSSAGPAVSTALHPKAEESAPKLKEKSKKESAAPARQRPARSRIQKPSVEIGLKEHIQEPPARPEADLVKEKIIEIDIPVALKDLALSLQEKPAVIIKKLLDLRIIANMNFALSEELAAKIALDYGYKIKRKPTQEELLFQEHQQSDPDKLKPRPPIVTFMGHVDHGKTSLLDAIRKSKVAQFEYGGITQHIGAYSVVLPRGKITFLDTPGHEAFTAMRARGAKVTDIVVLVVAADDGVMPQTIEAIDHAKEANATIIVALNKIDKPQLNLEAIKKQLADLGLMPEDWGGKTITIGVSAKTGQGIDGLLDMILLESEMLELKADPLKSASGVVLDAKICEGRGSVVTLLVENGTLNMQDAIIAGPYYAKVRALSNEFNKQVQEAGPSCCVEVLGFSGLPEAGEQFFVLADEKKAKEIAARRKEELREKELRPVQTMSLEELSNQIKEGKVKELKLILKADVSGSLEAISESLNKIESQEVRLNIIHKGIGGINVSDIILAQVSGAIITGFHVDTDERSREEAKRSGVEIRTYNVIYELINDLKTALEGLLEPKLKKKFLGRIIVRQMFKLSRSGSIAGCYVEKGKVLRASKASLSRNAQTIYEGSLQSLKRFKDDVKEVSEGMECGVSLSNFPDVMIGDVIEVYELERIARKL